MSKVATRRISSTSTYTKVEDYKMLIKFRLTLMVVASSVLAFMIANGASFTWFHFICLSIGGFAVTSAANGINQVLEKDFDAMMERTASRPLPANRMKSSEAVLFSGLILVAGIIALAMINPLTAFLGICSFVLYAFVYTPMKRYSTLSVAIGAIPGALPVLIGAVAAEGTITTVGVTLFMIQFLWQFPHFWAIAYLSFEDYDAAGYKLLPKSKSGGIDRNIGMYSALYSLLIFPVVGWAYYSGLDTHWFSLSLIIGCTLIYTAMAVRLQIKPSRRTALGLMFSSFFYLPLVLIFYLIG